MHQPYGRKYVVEYSSVFSDHVFAMDMDKAAAVALAIARTRGLRVLGVYTEEVFTALQAERAKGVSHAGKT